jgi:K+-sensing histidine kinase KdpD
MASQFASAALTLPWALAVAVGILSLGVALAWVRERRSAAQRRVMQRLYKLGEELTAGRSSTENLRLLQSVLPELLKVNHVRLYVLDRASKTLHPIKAVAAPGQAPATADGPGSFCEKAMELCVRNRSLIAIPDTRRDPFFDSSAAQGAPRSAMFIPMFAQEDLLGVLEIGDTRRERHFSEEERAGAQHLGNQIAIGMKLLGQKSLRERTGGSERLDAVYRLITSAAAELKQPIITIASASQAAMAHHSAPSADPEISRISAEAQRAAGILSRLLLLTKLHSEQEQPVDLADLVRKLVSLREEAWAGQGI